MVIILIVLTFSDLKKWVKSMQTAGYNGRPIIDGNITGAINHKISKLSILVFILPFK